MKEPITKLTKHKTHKETAFKFIMLLALLAYYYLLESPGIDWDA